jgi:hypothetical protein
VVELAVPVGNVIVELSVVPVPVIPTDVNVVVEPVFSVNVTNVEV